MRQILGKPLQQRTFLKTIDLTFSGDDAGFESQPAHHQTHSRGVLLSKKSKKGQIEVAPKKQTRKLRTTVLPFELFWTPIAERLM